MMRSQNIAKAILILACACLDSVALASGVIDQPTPVPLELSADSRLLRLSQSSGNQQTTKLKSLSPDPQRPLFKLPDPYGVVHSIREWDDKLLIINFWATWCPPCREEIPGFITLQAQYAHRGVQFLGVALDSAENVRNFVASQHMNYPTLRGKSAAIEVGKLYGNRYNALPFTAIVSPDGKIVHTQSGMLDVNVARALIQKFLDAP